MKKKTIILLIISAFLFAAGLCFYLFYQNNTNFYEPISISFKNFEVSDSNLVEIYAITPLDNEINVKYSYKNNNWETTKDSYSKSITIIIGESIASKYKLISVSTINKTIEIPIKNLQIVKSSEGKIHYSLPPEICIEKSFLKKSKHIILSNLSKILAFISILAVLIFLPHFIIKYRKGNLPKEVIFKWVRIVLISVIIAFGLFYGYLLIKYTLSSYFTAVIFIIITGLFLWYLNKFILLHRPRLQKHSKKIKVGILIFIIGWFCAESSLRFLDINRGYNETMTSFYSSGFNNDMLNKDPQNPHLFLHEKHSYYIDKKSEFSYVTKTNGEGLRDIDHPIEKQKDEVRIVCLGNSFTEGIGAPQDSTWSQLLENKLQEICNKKITVFNAGMSGSDPYFEYMLLKEKMLEYKPDFVLVALQVTDFNFYRFRGGFERFTNNGFQYRKPPSWERLYAVSYVYRFILNNLLNYENKFLQSHDDYLADGLNANRDIENCVNSYYQLSLQENFKLAIVFLDTKGGSRYDFLIKKLKKEGIISVIDLKEYNRNVEKISEEDMLQYFWKIDMHCNSNGYNLISKGIIWNFTKSGIVDSLNNITIGEK